MIHGYSANMPFVNNYAEALRCWSADQSTPMPLKAKSIMVTRTVIPQDEEGNPLAVVPEKVFEEHMASYRNKIYRTTSIQSFFGKWSMTEFEYWYNAQQKLCYETLNLLKITKNEYSEKAIQETEAQYRDLFFAYDFVFPVSEVMKFLKTNNEEVTIEPSIEKALAESRNEKIQIPVPPSIEEIIGDNNSSNETILANPIPLIEEPQRSTSTTTTPLVEFQEPTFNQEMDNIVGVSVEELIKQSKFTFRPIIRGSPVYLKWQEDIIYDQSKIIVVLGSRQIGKSYVMALRAYLSSYKGYRRDIMVCAYITETTDHIKKYFERLIENLPEEAWKHNSQKNYWENTITKSRVIFRSLSEDGHRIRGNTLHEVIIDECLLIDNDSFESVIRPTVSVTGGNICMISTPGEKNWFFDEVQAAKQGIEGYSYYEITADNNPLLDPHERKRIEAKKDSPVIQREYYCKFIEGEGTVFRPMKTTDISLLTNDDMMANAWFVMSYDPARKGNDKAAYACSFVYNGRIVFFRVDSIPDHIKAEWKTQMPFLGKIRIKFPFSFIMDSTTVGDAVVAIAQQEFEVNCAITYTGGDGYSQDNNWPYGKTFAYNVGKSEMINVAMNYIDEGIAQFFPYTCKGFFTEVEGLKLSRTSLGHTSFKTKGKDDETNAVMMNIWYIHINNLLTKPVPRKKTAIVKDTAYKPVVRPGETRKYSNSFW